MSLQSAQQAYDNMQPELPTIKPSKSYLIGLGDWPDNMVVEYSIIDNSDEDGKSFFVKVDSAKLGDFNFLECLHEGAVSQLEDDVLAVVLEIYS
jgi:hypothetical protein